ncbi:MAG: toxic anion resistance protein [Tissierellia bacterium]|nr:toxic anion resistance protein [Tissierellia bacterium]
MTKFDLQLDVADQEDVRLKNIDTENVKEEFKRVTYTPEEEKQIEDFSHKIDLHNSNIILQYGVGAQKKITDFSEKTLDAVKGKDLGEIGQLLNNIVVELKSIDDDEEEKGIRGFFKKQANKFDQMKVKYQTAEKNVEQIVKSLENHQITLLKDISLLDQMYELNEDYFKELSMYIEAGNRKLKRCYEEELPELEKRAKETNFPEDAQKVNDLQQMANRFDKKLHDLDLTRMVSLQMAPQIRMVQASNALMAEKIQTTIANTIPLWKNQMVLSLGINHSKQAIKAQNQVNEMTNKLLKSNADQLKINTIETAKASERGVVDVDTIKHTNESLISALEEVRNIQIEGKKKREEAKHELRNLEDELKKKLLH